MKKFLALLFTCVLVLSLSFAVYATEGGTDPETPTVTTGSITVKNATKGHTYNAYKILDATYQGTGDNLKVSYSTTAANKEKFVDVAAEGENPAVPCPFDVAETAIDGKYYVQVGVKTPATETTPAVYYSNAEVIAWLEKAGPNFTPAISGVYKDANSTVTFNSLDFGYYYITSSLGTAVTIDTAAPDAEVIDKNTTTPVDAKKEIVKIDGVAVSSSDNNPVTTANAHVGSIVEFKVTAKTNNWENSTKIREEWSMKDTPRNMAVDLSSIEIKFNGTAVTNYTVTPNTSPATGEFTITVPMVNKTGEGNAEQKGSIYAAAEDGLISIEITYKATITADAGKNPAENEVPGNKVEVDTYGFKITKTDGTNALPGAQFELWSAKGVANGTAAALRFIDDGNGTYTYSEAETGTVTTLDMTTNTTITILGLDNGWTYTLKETKAPDGFNPIDPLDIAGTKLTKVDKPLAQVTLYEEEVVNKQGQELPSTGGIGTTIFYAAGIMLVIGACVLFAARKKISVK